MNATPQRVPVSRAVRWREFRERGVPALVFVLGVAGAGALWERAVAPPSLLAEAEAIRTEVRAGQAGQVAVLSVQPLQAVRAGEEIGRLWPADPRVLEATLAMIAAEVDLMRANLEPVQTARRVALDEERLRLEWLRERVALASLRAQLQDAEAALARRTPLFNGSVLSEEAFSTAKVLRDGLQAQVAAQSALVDRLAPVLEPAARPDPLGAAAPAATMEAALRVQEQRLRLAEAQLGPVVLRAPIDGIVTAVLRRGGEQVAAGEPILVVSASRSERLVGYVRQPLAIAPKVGQRAVVHTRSAPRRVAEAVVERVGESLEPVSPTLLAAVNRPGAIELGLQVHLTLPPDFTLHPGECVEVVLRD